MILSNIFVYGIVFHFLYQKFSALLFFKILISLKKRNKNTCISFSNAIAAIFVCAINAFV